MKSLRTRLRVAVLASVASVVVVASATPALASDVAPTTSLANLVDEGKRWLMMSMAGPTAASDPTARTTTDAPTAMRPAVPPRLPPAEEQRFIDLWPSASIIARDWRGSLTILGDRRMTVDDLRPSASNRMVIGRIATNAARLSLFAQLGAGQWRIDTVMFPSAVSYSELAGQAGGGFELRLTARLRVASELEYTVLYRDLHSREGEVAPRMTSFITAAAGTF